MLVTALIDRQIGLRPSEKLKLRAIRSRTRRWCHPERRRSTQKNVITSSRAGAWSLQLSAPHLTRNRQRPAIQDRFESRERAAPTAVVNKYWQPAFFQRRREASIPEERRERVGQGDAHAAATSSNDDARDAVAVPGSRAPGNRLDRQARAPRRHVGQRWQPPADLRIIIAVQARAATDAARIDAKVGRSHTRKPASPQVMTSSSSSCQRPTIKLPARRSD